MMYSDCCFRCSDSPDWPHQLVHLACTSPPRPYSGPLSHASGLWLIPVFANILKIHLSPHGLHMQLICSVVTYANGKKNLKMTWMELEMVFICLNIIINHFWEYFNCYFKVSICWRYLWKDISFNRSLCSDIKHNLNQFIYICYCIFQLSFFRFAIVPNLNDKCIPIFCKQFYAFCKE